MYKLRLRPRVRDSTPCVYKKSLPAYPDGKQLRTTALPCVVVVVKYSLKVAACTAPRFWHSKCTHPPILSLMPIAQGPQFSMEGVLYISKDFKCTPIYHPHSSDPQETRYPRAYTPNPQCPRSGMGDRGSQR